MSDFITILKKSIVASTRAGVMTTNQFKNITVDRILARLKVAEVGEKNGSHFIRTALKQQGNYCASRGDNNAASMASVLIIDCDKRIDSNGKEHDGAPNPCEVSESLKAAGIGHILFGSYSYYCGLMRYRIILVTATAYSKEQLSPTVEGIVALININLSGDLLAYASENAVWSQPWYYPRKPSDSNIEPLYIEYLEGNAVDVVEPESMTPITHSIQRKIPINAGEVSPIHTFNEQNNLTELLSVYGYKHVLTTNEFEKWLSPDSISGKAGITVKDNKFFCHHSSDQFHDGYWHDAFD